MRREFEVPGKRETLRYKCFVCMGFIVQDMEFGVWGWGGKWC